MNYRSFEDMAGDVRKLKAQLPRKVDLVVGIPRSGMPPAAMLALLLNCSLTDVDGFLSGRVAGHGQRSLERPTSDVNRGAILVIDDSVDSGSAMEDVRARLSNGPRAKDILYCCLYVSGHAAARHVDLYARIVPRPRVFEWNVLHHPRMESFCMDIDGVFCPDPSARENDDGENYLQFITTAEARYVPPYAVGHLVTSRLEKYRAETEAWLRENGIKYGRLHMLSGMSARDRARTGAHATFKADVYRQTDAWLFIESSLFQAIQIAAIARRPVFCTDVSDLILPTEGPMLQSMRGRQASLKEAIYWKRRAATSRLRAIADRAR